MAVEGVWVKRNPDTRGYANRFKCSECGFVIVLGVYDKECEYPYCPWCRAEMIETVEVNEDGKTD